MLCKLAECTFHFSFNLPLAFSCVYLCADCVSSLLSTFKYLFWPAKRQVKGYMCVQKVDNPSRNYEIINFFVLNIFTKPIFCSKIPQKGKSCSRLLEPQKVAPNAKSCSKVTEHNRDRTTANQFNNRHQSSRHCDDQIIPRCWN